MYRRWITCLLALLLFTACGGSAATTTSAGGSGGGTTGASDSGVTAPVAAPASEPARASEGEADGDQSASGLAEQNAVFGERQVIRTGTLTLLVRGADDAEAQIRTLVQRLGGYVLSSQTQGDEQYRGVRLSFKVPAERFNDALDELEKLAIEVRSRSITGQDVTDEFVDTESRLRNLRATEARLLEFLQQARNVEEALQVNQQLSELQGQIEQASGRIKYLQESVAFSTVNVDLQPDVAVAITSQEAWSPVRVARNALRGLVAFGQGLAEIGITLAIWSPVWGILALVAWTVWRRFGRSAPPAAQSTQPGPSST